MKTEMGIEELIDTLWNVNKHQQSAFGMSPGINRYIMECKLLRLACQRMSRLAELIDTLWNVNTVK